MKTPPLLSTLLLAALPASVFAAPGTVHGILQKIAHGNGVTLADGDLFGSSCAVVGDLDGDGVPELAVGAVGDDTGGNSRGAVHLLFLNTDGSVKSIAKIAHGSSGLDFADLDFFGGSCAAVGDINRDGVPDLAVGAIGDNTGGSTRGALYVLFLERDGSVVSFSKIAHGSGGLSLVDGDTFGASCSLVGDLDGDGVPELAVGAHSDGTGGSARGAVHLLFLDDDGSVKSTTKIAHGNGVTLTNFNLFGSSCAVVGDLDGDGVPELAVGASDDNFGGNARGAVHLLFLNSNGSVKSAGKILHGSGGLSLANNDRFGGACLSPGDLDGDGIPELVVGASGDDLGGDARGAFHLLFLNADGTVKSHTKIAHGSGDLTLSDNDSFGQSCAALGDLDGDGVPEIAVGAHGDNTGGNVRGAVHLIELGDPPLTVTTLVDEFDNPGTGFSLREAIIEADTTGEFRTIRFDPSLSGGAFELNLGIGSLAPTTQSLRITGEDLVDGVTLSGGDLGQLFVLDDAVLTVDSLNIRDGSFSGGGSAFLVDSGSRLVLDRVTVVGCDGFGGGGGAILSEGSVVITNSTFLENTADSGGAIRVSGATADLTVTNTTFANNSATVGTGGGGAIACVDGATARIRHATFVENVASNAGGAISTITGTTLLRSSIFSGNVAGTASTENSDGIFYIALEPGEENASVSISEMLPLGDYGGLTPTRPLKPTSSTKGTNAFIPLPATDQRGPGFPRTVGAGRDPGAVEGTELSDFQPDNRIGLSLGRQIGNNVYNANGVGQTIALKLSGKRKAKTFFTVENDGLYLDSIRMKSDAPSRRSLNGKVFSLTGGRRNVSAQVFRTGLLLSDVVPSGSAAFQGEWSRKSRSVKPKQTAKLRSTSTTAPKSDVAGTRVSGK